MNQSLAIAVAILLTTQVAFAQDKRKRPPIPEGFAWQDLEEIKGAVLIPDEWHFSKTATKDAFAYRVTKEKLEEGIDTFLTGLTINVVKDVPGKSKVKSSLYSVKVIKGYLDSAAATFQKPKIDKAGPFQRITCIVDKKLSRVDNETLFRIRVTTLANDETGTLYIMIFGSPTEAWEETYKTGKQLFSPIMLRKSI